MMSISRKQVSEDGPSRGPAGRKVRLYVAFFLPRSGARSYLIVLGSQISRSPGPKALVCQLRCEGPTTPYPLCALKETSPCPTGHSRRSVDRPLDRPGFDVDHTMVRSLTVRSRARSGLASPSGRQLSGHHAGALDGPACCA